jgi:hypothetical protein
MKSFQRPAAGPVGPLARCGFAAAPSGLLRAWLAAAAATVCCLGGPPAQATPFQWFTDESSFLAALDPGSFTATGTVLNSGGGDLGSSSKTFTGTGNPAYGFTVMATGGLYGTNPGIAPLEYSTPLTFQTFTPSQGVTAFGGLFSLRDLNDARQAGNLSLALFTGGAGNQSIASQSLSVTSSAPSFLGLITYGGTQPITKVTLTATTSPGSLVPTAEQVIVGVPEPSTVAAFSTAAVLLGIAFRLRKRAGRIVAIGIALAIVGMDVATIAADPPPAAAAAENAVGKAVEKAAGLRAANKPDEALEVLRQATRAVKQSAGDEAAELLPIYELATEILIETEAGEKAAALLQKSLALHAKLLEEAGESDQQLTASHARAILLESRLHAHDGRLLPAVESSARAARMLDGAAGPAAADIPRAVAQLEAAVKAVADLLGPTHESALEANLVAAEALESIGQCGAAAARRATRLAAVRESLGAADADSLADACHVARLRMAAGQAGDAVADLESALESAPPETRGYAAAVRSLGRLHQAAEQFAAARQAFLRAAELDAASPGMTPVAPLHDKLLAASVAFRSRGPAPTAELDALVAALPAKLAGSDPAAPTVVEALLDAAEIALDVGRPQLAKDLGGRGLALAKGCPAVPAEERIALAVAAARPLVGRSEQAKAKAALERAVQEAESQIGRSHPQTQAAVLALAECLAATKPAAARPLVERLLASGAASPRADSDERLVRLFESVGATQASDGSGRTATAWGDELLQLRRGQWGAEHPRVAATCLSLAAGRLGAGAVDAAIARCREAIALQEQSLGRDHPEVAASLLVEGDAYRRGGQFDEAAAAVSRSLAVWEAKAGHWHDATLAAVRSLAGVRLAQGRAADALPLLERLLAADTDAAQAQPARHARLLVRLAGVLATTDAAERSRRCLKEAISLPCFDPADEEGDPDNDPAVRELALTLAEAARVFTVLDDKAAATEAVRRARGLAIGMASPRDTLALIDGVASGGKPLPAGRL